MESHGTQSQPHRSPRFTGPCLEPGHGTGVQHAEVPRLHLAWEDNGAELWLRGRTWQQDARRSGLRKLGSSQAKVIPGHAEAALGAN